jgi:hypothetical protein
MLTAFLDSTYTPRAAGGWYRGSGEDSFDGHNVHFEVLVRASTAAQALVFCPQIANSAAWFFGSSGYRLTLGGRIDVPIGGGVTYKDATFAPVACPAVASASDPVGATRPLDTTAAVARLSNFLDDYLRKNDWFIAAVHGVDSTGAPRVTISTSDGRATASGRCATMRPFVTWFLGTARVEMVVAPETGVKITC